MTQLCSGVSSKLTVNHQHIWIDGKRIHLSQTQESVEEGKDTSRERDRRKRDKEGERREREIECVCVWERERQRGRETETERERDKEGDRKRGRQRGRATEIETKREREGAGGVGSWEESSCLGIHIITPEPKKEKHSQFRTGAYGVCVQAPQTLVSVCVCPLHLF